MHPPQAFYVFDGRRLIGSVWSKYVVEDVHLSSAKVNKEKNPQTIPELSHDRAQGLGWKGHKEVFIFQGLNPWIFSATRKGKIDRDTVKSGRNDVKIMWVPGGVVSVNSHNYSDQRMCVSF